MTSQKISYLEEILKKSWSHYKRYKIDSQGRPLADLDTQDFGAGSQGKFLTFSESVSYVLFRSIIINDQETFNKVWKWAYHNMWRINLKKVFHWQENKWKALPASERDHLFSWRYTPNIKNSGKGGIILYTWSFETAGDIWRDGHEVAPDGDALIAGSLILAHQKWKSTAGVFDYKNHAQKILNDLWKKCVVYHQPSKLFDWQTQENLEEWFDYKDANAKIQFKKIIQKENYLQVKISKAKWAGFGKPYISLNLEMFKGLEITARGNNEICQVILEDQKGKKATWVFYPQPQFKKHELLFKEIDQSVDLKNIKTIMFQPSNGTFDLKNVFGVGQKFKDEYHLVSNAKQKVWINLSYYMPFLYRNLFPKVDKKNPWKKLLHSSIVDFKKSFELDSSELKIKNSKILPADWFSINNLNKVESVPFISHLNQDAFLSSWDAFRAWFFYGWDYFYSKDPKIKSLLLKGKVLFKKHHKEKGHIPTGFLLNGKSLKHRGCHLESFAANGVYLALMTSMGEKKLAQKILEQTNEKWLAEDHFGYFWGNDPTEYYGQNWFWLGLAFYLGKMKFK